MTTRMTHPEHGATHAYGEQDIKKHEALGWSVEAKPAPDEFQFYESPAPMLSDEQIDALEAAAVVPLIEKRKPGRPAKAK